jgi:TetR/AcrR family transcriptional repressor of nem operon
MSKGEQTRREIVEKAAPIFNQKGYEGASLSDLMDATGLQKGGIYRHFSSKEELAGEAFDYAWDRAVRGRLDGVEEISNSVDRLKKMIGNFVEVRAGLVPGGCPLMNTGVESDDGNAILRGRAKKALQGWVSRIAKITAVGIARDEIISTTDSEKLALLIISSLEGALLVSRLEKDREPLRNMRQHLDEYLETSVRAKASPSRR